MNQVEIEEMLAQSQSGKIEVTGKPNREYADATASASWTLFGEKMEGWITYAETKIYLEPTSIDHKSGFFGGAGFVVHNPILKPELLNNKTGTFVIRTISPILADLQIFVDGKSVFSGLPFLLHGAGSGRMSGKVLFTVAK